MSTKTVVIFGGTGMLGSMVLRYLGTQGTFNLIGTANPTSLQRGQEALPNIHWQEFSISDEETTRRTLQKNIPVDSWIINTIGITKVHIQENDPQTTLRAIRINSAFPHWLTEEAAKKESRIIQIATDCVYSGRDGGYLESDVHDALDVYGKTKSLGEVSGDNVHHIRCSIIGPELGRSTSLLEWFLEQPKGSNILGFTNHLWNGVTTLQYAKVCEALIRDESPLPSRFHLVPADVISKCDLLSLFAKYFHREDIVITPKETTIPIDRTLQTTIPEASQTLWQQLELPQEGPTMEQMIQDLASQYTQRRRR